MWLLKVLYIAPFILKYKAGSRIITINIFLLEVTHSPSHLLYKKGGTIALERQPSRMDKALDWEKEHWGMVLGQNKSFHFLSF